MNQLSTSLDWVTNRTWESISWVNSIDFTHVHQPRTQGVIDCVCVFFFGRRFRGNTKDHQEILQTLLKFKGSGSHRPNLTHGLLHLAARNGQVRREIRCLFFDPPANFLYKMVGHVPHIKPFFNREFLVFFWMLEPVLYHFTFLDLCTSIL